MRGVMRDMSLLSEAKAVRYDTDRVKGSASKSAPPPGFRVNRRDLRDLSLAEFWSARFNQAQGDLGKLEFFLYLAERDLAQAKRRVEPVDPHETAGARSARVIRQYEGLSALEAAVAEGCTERWIRVTRMEENCDPETGWPDDVDRRLHDGSETYIP